LGWNGSASAKTVNGLTLTTMSRLANSIGHDMTVLSDAFKRIAPQRRLKLLDGTEVLLWEHLANAAAGPH
jgi:hypothetical protein